MSLQVQLKNGGLYFMFPLATRFLYTEPCYITRTDSVCSSEQLEGALRERRTHALRPLLLRDVFLQLLFWDLHAISACVQRAKKRLIPPAPTLRTHGVSVEMQAAALDHFLGCSAPIKKQLSVRVNVSNDRENGCPP